MMNPELQAAIDQLARDDAHIHAIIRACQRHGLNEVDTLAHIILNQQRLKQALLAQVLDYHQNGVPPIVLQVPERSA